MTLVMCDRVPSSASGETVSAFVADPMSPRSSSLVMVVDDDDSSREVMRFLLDEEGYRVVAFDSPASALATLPAPDEDVGVLLTDVHLPGMSGPELAGHVRALYPDVRVAFVTGDLEPPRGVDGAFIQKPVDLEEIIRFVELSLRRA